MTDKKNLPIAPHILESAASRVVDRCDVLAKCSEHPQAITRTFCSPAMKQAHAQLKTWMESAGLDCKLDSVGNLIGRQDNSSKQTLVIGSHLDTVINAGRFDGVLGVLLGLAVAEVASQVVKGQKLPFNLDVVAFSEEEGVRFNFPFIGSLGMVGQLLPSDLDRVDDDSVTMQAALAQFGCDVNQSAQYENDELIGFIEAHIEQADLLQEGSVPVGIVSAIAGQTRTSIVIEGFAGHAGTVGHDRRKDALAAAAELILKIEEIGQQTDGLFATVGRISSEPGLSNVICGGATISLDLRHAQDDVRDQAFEAIQSAVKTIADKRSVAITLEDIQRTPAVPMDPELVKHMADAVEAVGLTEQMMVSGAGHDAMIMARATGSCMLFVRCRDGISHHPSEFVSAADVEVALEVMVRAVFSLADSNQG